MRNALFGIVATVFLVTQAHAGRVVMSYSDSRGGSGATPYPVLVDNARSDFTVCNKFNNGWTSLAGLNNLTAKVAECAATGEVSDVLIMFGVNDTLYVSGVTSEQVAARLIAMADAVEAMGIRAWILLEFPGPVAWGGSIDARKWTRNNVEAVLKIGAGYRFINARDELLLNYLHNGNVVAGHWFKSAPGDQIACASDGLHPTHPGCLANIANLIAVTLP